MNDERDMNGTVQFAPQADDTIEELLRKACGMVDHLRVNEAALRLIPASRVDESIDLWLPLIELLTRAMFDPALEDDARLEMQRVWAEEMFQSAMVIVTMCSHLRTEQARRFFAAKPWMVDKLIEGFENRRPAALRVLSTEVLEELRVKGFLRDGE